MSHTFRVIETVDGHWYLPVPVGVARNLRMQGLCRARRGGRMRTLALALGLFWTLSCIAGFVWATVVWEPGVAVGLLFAGLVPAIFLAGEDDA